MSSSNVHLFKDVEPHPVLPELVGCVECNVYIEIFIKQKNYPFKFFFFFSLVQMDTETFIQTQG